ncbi:hypothetical protein D3C76_1056000 [compost metagenome]
MVSRDQLKFGPLLADRCGVAQRSHRQGAVEHVFSLFDKRVRRAQQLLRGLPSPCRRFVVAGKVTRLQRANRAPASRDQRRRGMAMQFAGGRRSLRFETAEESRLATQHLDIRQLRFDKVDAHGKADFPGVDQAPFGLYLHASQWLASGQHIRHQAVSGEGAYR